MDELNRKLAEWAGLHRNEPTGGFWWDSEGNLIFDFHKPEEKGFTHSLDQCFKWLVSKAIAEFGIGKVCNALSDALFHAYMLKTYDTADRFCKAIEKLIL